MINDISVVGNVPRGWGGFVPPGLPPYVLDQEISYLKEKQFEFEKGATHLSEGLYPSLFHNMTGRRV